MVKTMKVGVIGCGAIAQRAHIPTFNSIEGVEVQAVCDINEEKARKTAKKYKIKEYYTDYKTMLENPSINLVSICTPPNLHAEIIIEAARAGKHVLVEKPLATKLKDALKAIQTAKENKIKLCVTHNYRYYPAIRKAKTLIDNGKLGRITSITHQANMRIPLTWTTSTWLTRRHWTTPNRHKLLAYWEQAKKSRSHRRRLPRKHEMHKQHPNTNRTRKQNPNHNQHELANTTNPKNKHKRNCRLHGGRPTIQPPPNIPRTPKPNERNHKLHKKTIKHHMVSHNRTTTHIHRRNSPLQTTNKRLHKKHRKGGKTTNNRRRSHTNHSNNRSSKNQPKTKQNNKHKRTI